MASIGDAVIATDCEGRVALMNPSAEALTGWPLDKAQGQLLEQVYVLISEETRSVVESSVAKALREGCIVSSFKPTRLIARDETERVIDDSAAPIRDRENQIIGVVLVFRDVTERAPD